MSIAVRRGGRWVLGLFIIVWCLGPIYWAANVSLSTQVGLEKVPPPLVPSPFTWENYKNLLSPSSPQSATFYDALRNSIVEAGGATIAAVVVSILAGYAFGRWKFRGSGLMFLAIIGMLSVPLLVVLLPLFRITADLGVMDTYLPIIVLNLTTTMPLAVWIMRSFVAALPADIEAAARVDGAGPLQVLWYVVLPLLRPAMTAVAIIVFLTSWSQFLAPLLFSQSSATQPLTVLIPTFVTKNATDYGIQAAAGCAAIVPPLLLVLALHRYLLNGLLRGAFK